jgi:cytoskeletal protein RodZ
MSAEDTSEPQVEAIGTGGRLRAAREAAGLSVAQLSETTKINTRHLVALESGNFATLPGRSYALGFARSYARAVGLDEEAIVASVRADYAGAVPQADVAPTQTFAPGDPARVPSAGFAWVAGLVALIAAVGGYVWWQNDYRPSVELPSLLPAETPAPQPSAAPNPHPNPSSPIVPSGAVVFTAQGDSVWVRFYDGTSKKTLLEKAMTKGEIFTVPADVTDPRLWTGHPEGLDITIGGQAIPRLANEMKTMKDVPVTASALLARSTASPAPAPTSTPTTTPTSVASDVAPRPTHPRMPRPRHRSRGETVTAGGVLPAGVPLVAPSPAATGGNP